MRLKQFSQLSALESPIIFRTEFEFALTLNEGSDEKGDVEFAKLS